MRLEKGLSRILDDSQRKDNHQILRIVDCQTQLVVVK